MRIWSTVLVAALAGAALPLSSGAARADGKDNDEKTVTMDQIPEAARKALVREAGSSPILKVEQETEQGQTLYEAQVRKGDDILGIRVNASGTVVDRHSEKHENEKE
jgi:hypothetical protein